MKKFFSEGIALVEALLLMVEFILMILLLKAVSRASKGVGDLTLGFFAFEEPTQFGGHGPRQKIKGNRDA